MNKQFKIVGIRTLNTYSDENYYTNDIIDKTEILLLEDEGKNKYELELKTEYVDCYGGGSEVYAKLYEVKDFIGEKHYIPDNLRGYFVDLPIDESGDIDFEEHFKCDIFEFTESQDAYYPDGEVDIDYSKFMRTIRYKDNRVVYIFRGKSGIGKTYLAGFINQRENVFESDVHDKLPFEITDNIIVIGNKHGYTIEDIINRIPDKDTCEIITVDFNEFKEDFNKTETDKNNKVIQFKRK